MDESWRMRMGHPPRRSVGNPSVNILTDDFSDVFGGPPRTALLRKLSGDFTHSTSFYDEIFRLPEFGFPARAKSGRSLPAFNIPARSDGLYGDVFGNCEDDGKVSRSRSRSGSRSKADSSSIFSSEEMSPFSGITRDDVGLSSIASKLRPLNVPGRWKSSKVNNEHPKDFGMPVFPTDSSSFVENQFMDDEYCDNLRSFHCGYSGPMASPEAISIDPNSYGSVKMSTDDLETNSPSSVVSSLCVDWDVKSVMPDPLPEEDVDDDDDEVASSFVIEIASDPRDTNSEAVSVEDAIAWAREKSQMHNSVELSSKEHEKKQPTINDETPTGCRALNGYCLEFSREGQITSTSQEGNLGSDEDVQLKILDEEIKLWSAGKETNIRFLLSALDHVLWPNSGWIPIPLTCLMQSKHVKKAYQKARLCLHPDKLQQRGATALQRYIADKVFLILQDAWAAYISQDLLFG